MMQRDAHEIGALAHSDAAEHFRALAARLSQRIRALHSDVMLLADRSRMLHDEAAAQLTAATNNSLFVLTILTTLLLPATLVTGFFGMNTKGLPFGELENGTVYAFVMCCLASAVVYWIIRRKNVLG